MVTPCVGVWIETAKFCELDKKVYVTPCVGVWIETQVEILTSKSQHVQVTPCVGVWIETFSISSYKFPKLSHPAWVCGLKPADNLCRHTTRVSHPAWVCGLKLLRADRTHTHVCHTLRGCVD